MKHQEAFSKTMLASALSKLKTTAPAITLILSSLAATGASAQLSADAAARVAARALGQTIEAQDFDAETVAGSHDEYSVRRMTREGKVGYIKPDGNWIRFSDVGFGNEGASKVIVSASSETKNGGILSFSTSSTGLPFTQVRIEPTGKWSKFEDFEDEIISSPVGSQTVYLTFTDSLGNTGGNDFLYDIASIRFENPTESIRALDQTVEAEEFDLESEAGSRDEYSVRRFKNEGKVGYIKPDSNWIRFDDFDFGNGVASVSVKASSATQGGILNFHNGSPQDLSIFASVTIDSTGNWGSYEEFTTDATAPANGSGTLFLTFDGIDNNDNDSQQGEAQFLFDIDSFRLNSSSATKPVEKTPEAAAVETRLLVETSSEHHNGVLMSDANAELYFSPNELDFIDREKNRSSVTWNGIDLTEGRKTVNLRVKSKDGTLRKGQFIIIGAGGPQTIETSSTEWVELTLEVQIDSNGPYNMQYHQKSSTGQDDRFQALDLDYIEIID